MNNPGIVAAIHVAGVRGDPCGAVRWTAGILNSVFFKFSKFLNIQ